MRFQPCSTLCSRGVLVPAFLVLLGATLATGLASDAHAAGLWRVESALQASESTIFPAGSPVVTLDRSELTALLAQAPSADQALDRSAQLPEITLPMPDGSWERFSFHVSRTMSPGLAARYPEIRAFAGTGRTNLWRVRFVLTPKGLRASIWTPEGRSVIQAIDPSDRYATAYVQDLAVDPALASWTCEVDSETVTEQSLEDTVQNLGRNDGPVHGDELYTYRLAVAGTGEYTGQHGGTVPGALAVMVNTINTINEVMGREWSVALELIPNNDLIIFTDPATDPYSNGDLSAMLGQNQAAISSIIGGANYDIGHVFGTGGGGLASVSVVCVLNSKSRAASSANATGTDAFALLAAHEMGHQFSARHTFNGDEGGCAGNRTATSAYEPGSGTTIMAYPGLCGSQNIQLLTHDYYHTRSWTQVISFINAGSGSNCVQLTPTGNTPPVSMAGNVGNTIPLDTPFALTGSGFDADGDDLTYCWEQYNLGPAGHPDFPVDNAPLFRSRQPKTVPERVFPRIQEILSGNHRIGEILPFYARNMRFRLTVRDGLGGAHWEDVVITATDTGAPFRVTSQSTSETLTAGNQILVTWDVANTNGVDVNCQTVNILMAEDGKAYDYVLLAGTPNDGSEMVTVPGMNTTTARIKVEAADNIFFDINDADLTVSGAVGVEPILSAIGGLRLDPARPNPFSGRTSISYSLPGPGQAKLGIYDTAGRLVRVLQDGPVPGGYNSATWDGLSGAGSAAASGIYFLRLDTNAGQTRMQKVHLIR